MDSEFKILDTLQFNTRYCGILEPTRKIANVIEYACVLSSTFGSKIVQAKIIGNGTMKTYIEWLKKIAIAKPKYAQIVIIENGYFVVDTI